MLLLYNMFYIKAFHYMFSNVDNTMKLPKLVPHIFNQNELFKVEDINVTGKFIF